VSLAWKRYVEIDLGLGGSEFRDPSSRGRRRYRGGSGKSGKASHGFDPRLLRLVGCSDGAKGSIEVI
jgi:hypothetical protein